VLYVFPGIISYRMISGEYPPVSVILAAGLWTAAMHAYSAIPDIEADREAGLDTIATVLKPFWSLVLCGVLYGLAAVLSFKYLSWLSVLLGAVYLLIVTISFTAVRRRKLFELYRLFPLVNAACGFCLFWYAALTRLIN